MSKKPIVINIRGNSGSGKTHLTREFMKKFKINEPMWFGDADKTKRAHAMVDDIRGKFCVIGSYDNACGGCDTIKTQAEVVNRVHLATLLGFKVIWLEGLIMSTIYGTVGDYSEQFKDRWVFAYLTTPLDVCLERIYKRREQAGQIKPFNELNTRNRVASIESSRMKCLDRGRRVVDLDWCKPLPQLLTIIRKEGL